MLVLLRLLNLFNIFDIEFQPFLYYYFLSNIVTFTQQWAIKKFVDEDKLKAQIHESKSKKVDDKKSAFQKRLEEIAKAKDANKNVKKK